MYKTVFVFYKEDKIKVLNCDDAANQIDQLIFDGWLHTQTLNACRFIEFLFNECEDLGEEIKSLSKK